MLSELYGSCVGQALKILRQEKKLSQQCVARRARVSVKRLRAWENGKEIPDAKSVGQIEKILGVSSVEVVQEVLRQLERHYKETAVCMG